MKSKERASSACTRLSPPAKYSYPVQLLGVIGLVRGPLAPCSHVGHVSPGGGRIIGADHDDLVTAVGLAAPRDVHDDGWDDVREAMLAELEDMWA